MLEKDPSARYADASELAAALLECGEVQEVQTTPVLTAPLDSEFALGSQ